MRNPKIREIIRSILAEGDVIDIRDKLPAPPEEPIDEMPIDPVDEVLQDIYENLGTLEIPQDHPAFLVSEEILSALDLYFGSEINDEDGDSEVSQDERQRFLAFMNMTRGQEDEDLD